MANDNRKHYTQMASEEIQALMKAVRSRTYTFCGHALDRMRQKKVTAQQIAGMLTYATIIEAHENIPGDVRVLVRGKVAGNFVCAVVSLTKNEVVTVYWNQAGDHHQTLDRSIYTLTRDFAATV
jgi:hypothetical protein